MQTLQWYIEGQDIVGGIHIQPGQDATCTYSDSVLAITQRKKPKKIKILTCLIVDFGATHSGSDIIIQLTDSQKNEPPHGA